MTRRAMGWALLAACLSGAATAAPRSADPRAVLWQIGKPDGKNAEFVLAPSGYASFRDDAFYVVGQSSASRDWPYVQPGPTDPWAGLRRHTFTVLFGVAAAPPEGTCRLRLDLLDTHSGNPPSLEIRVNGAAFVRKLPTGAGDASVYGRPEAGRRHTCEVDFPARLLAQGNNRVEIVTAAGSWLLYDAVTLLGPPGVRTAPVAPTIELRPVAIKPGLIERDGKQMRRIRATAARVGPPVRAEFQLDGRPVRSVELTGGVQSVDLLVDAPSTLRKAELSLLVEGRRAGRESVSLTPGLREVIVVFKTHFDIGYTALAREVVERYRTSMIDNALSVCDAAASLPPEQRFAWTIPGWPMQQMLWPGQTPERRRRIEKAVADGRLVWHALPFTLHTELLETEDIVRGLGYASRLSRAAGLPLPRDAKMTDVSCHAWVLPTLLCRSGIDFLHLGANEGVAPALVPPLFWWEGPDGSRLLTMYSVGYGTRLSPPSDWPYRTWLALIHTGDNHGPPTADEVKQLFEQARRELPGVRVRIGRLSDFADRIRAEKPDVPVVRGDMTDSWIHGPMCDPQGARLARNVRPLIAATEVLSTQLGLWGVSAPAPTAKIASAYEQSLLYGEHTWGGALYWITQYTRPVQFFYGAEWQTQRAAGRFRRIEESWDEHSRYIRTADALTTPTLAGQLASLAALATQASGIHGSQPQIVVYNPLPWRRDGLVRVGGVDETIAAFAPVGGGANCPVARQGGDVVFVARDVPSLGYRTYVAANVAKPQASPLASVRADREAGVIESPAFRLTLDKSRGAVRSLVDKRSSRELAQTHDGRLLGQYLYERFDAKQTLAFVDAFVPTRPDWALVELNKPNLPPADKAPYRAASPVPDQADFAQSAVAACAVFRAPAGAGVPHAVTSRFTVYQDLPCVDLEITLHDKPADPWPEAGWICLPLAVDQPQFRLGRQNSLVDPTRDLVRGANRHLLGLNTGVTVLDPGGSGVGICPIDHPLISLDQPGCWRYSLDFTPRRPVVYVNLFNNQFTSNFRLWNEGTVTSRVRIWAIDAQSASAVGAEASLTTLSWEARLPLLASVGRQGTGRLPPSQAGLELSRGGVRVTAFGPNPDGPGLILRLWEQGGRDGRCIVTLPAGLERHRARLCNLRGEALSGELRIENRRVDVPLEHNAPTTLLLTP